MTIAKKNDNVKEDMVTEQISPGASTKPAKRKRGRVKRPGATQDVMSKAKKHEIVKMRGPSASPAPGGPSNADRSTVPPSGDLTDAGDASMAQAYRRELRCLVCANILARTASCLSSLEALLPASSGNTCWREDGFDCMELSAFCWMTPVCFLLLLNTSR